MASGECQASQFVSVLVVSMPPSITLPSRSRTKAADARYDHHQDELVQDGINQVQDRINLVLDGLLEMDCSPLSQVPSAGSDKGMYQASFDARLAVMERLFQMQQQQYSELSEKFRQSCEEVAALRECLEMTGVVSQASIERAAAQRRYQVALRQAIQLPEVVFGICKAAGASATCCLSVSSVEIHDSIEPSRFWIFGAAPGLGLQSKLYAVGGARGAKKALDSAEVFDSTSGAWRMLPAMPTARRSCAAAAADGKLYILGGLGATGEALRIVQQYDPKTNHWSTLPNMPSARCTCSAACLGGLLYAVGGSDGHGQVLNTCVCLMQNKWVTLSPMLTPRASCAAVAMGGCLYVAGGADSFGRSVSFFEKFEPRWNAWVSLPALPTPRAGCAAATVGGYIYVAGGFDSEGNVLDTVERFDIASHAWSTMPSMPTARARCAAACLDGKLFVVGGTGYAKQVLGTVEVFNPIKSTWSTGQSLLVARVGCAAAVAWEAPAEIEQTLDARSYL